MLRYLPVTSRWILLSCLTLVALGLTTLVGAQDGVKAPIPSKQAQAKARALIIEIFKDDLAGAKDAAAKTKLAGYLLQQGKDSKDEPANRYMLYVAARDLAAEAGDALLALSAVEELGRAFNVPVLQMKTAALAAAAAHLQSKEAASALVDLLMPLIAEAADADDYETALTLGRVAEEAAKKSKSIPLVAAVQKRNEEVRAVQKGFAHLEPYIERVKKDAKDAEANLELGRYFGLLKGKWEKAIPLLAMGNDAGLRAQARKDLADPKEGIGQLVVADGWWELAGKEKDPARLHLEARAKFWYEKAVVNLAGLNRTKALRRIDQISARLEGTPAAGPPGPVGEIRKFEGHSDEVKCVALSLDGRYAVSGGFANNGVGANENCVHIWNLATGKREGLLRGHSKGIYGVVFHPNNRQVASSSWDKTARLWDIKTAKEAKRFTHPIDVNGLAIARDGSKLLAGCDNKHAYLWNISTEEQIRDFAGFKDFVYAVAFAPDGKHVACGSSDKSIRVFDQSTGKAERVLEQGDAVTALAFSPDSRYLFSCGDLLAHKWDLTSGKAIRQFEGHKGRVLALALSLDGRRLVTGGDDQTVRFWDVASGKQVHIFEGHTGAVNSVAISADGHRALSGSTDRTVRLWGLPFR
jgi:WD40 repeat protein